MSRESIPATQAEEQIRAVHAARDFSRAASLALEQYGDEIFGLLVTCLGNSSDAEEVFSIFCEDFWHGLPGFKWHCTIRTWLYVVARNAGRRYLKSPHRYAERNVPLSQIPEMKAITQKIYGSTAVHLQTHSKDSLRQLRDQLSVADRMLLILRVDRGLSWHDMVMVMADRDQPDAPLDTTRAERRLRKRFERIKAKLRKLAEQQGLIARPT